VSRRFPFLEPRVRLVLNSDGPLSVENNATDLILDKDMEVGVGTILKAGQKVPVGGVLSLTILADVAKIALDSISCCKILDVLGLRVTYLVRNSDEVFQDMRDLERRLGDVDWTTVSVGLLGSRAVVCLELLLMG